MRKFPLLLCLMITLAASQAFAITRYKGVNLAGAEFAAEKLPGQVNKDYVYPSQEIISAYAKLGMNTIRLPFLWERVQPRLGGPLNPQEVKYIDAVIMFAASKHLTVILDVHNYGSYRGKFIGDADVPEEAYLQLWTLLANHYRDQANVAFGIMNEPYRQDAASWAKIANHALIAIRKTGTRQLVLIPGTLYTGAHSWNDKAGKLSNAQALAKLRDPANNMAIEIHHYFDSNYSGTHNACTAPEVTKAALTQVSTWLKKTRHKGFLAEFGVSKEPECGPAMQAALDHIKTHSDLWLGWTYWGASEWFGDYPFTIYPVKPEQFPQLKLLMQYLP